MASLQKFTVRGRAYWRIVESKRINGKPTPVPVLYIGSTEKLISMLMSAGSARPYRVHSFRHGDVAALKAAADWLGVADIIDHIVPTTRRSVSVGTCLVLAAIGRLVHPCSKRSWADWAQTTSLGQLFPNVDISRMTSQVFWDQMDQVRLEDLDAIESELAAQVFDRLGLAPDLLFYDTTNFYTYIATTNERSELAQRGHNKQKRHDLRQYGLAMAVCGEGRVPIFHQLYPGNRVDSQQFTESLTVLRKRLASLPVKAESVTLVYDRGNMSRPNQALVDGMEFGYVASLTPSQHPELASVPSSAFEELEWEGSDEVLLVYRTEAEVWGRKRTVVMYFSRKLREGQVRGLLRNLHRALGQLAEWKERLGRRGSGPRSVRSAEKRMDEILSRQHLRRVVHVRYDPEARGSDRLEYWVDDEALNHLVQEVYGRRILITDRHDWTSRQIIEAYHGQSDVERVFRELKDELHLALRPQYHWTDQKVQVHTFTCILGLLLGRVVQARAAKLGWRGGLARLLETLGQVRLALLLDKPGPKGGRPRAHWQLEDTDPQTMKLFLALVPNSEPFVYTAQSS